MWRPPPPRFTKVLCLALVALAVIAAQALVDPTQRAGASTCRLSSKLVPSCGRLTGAFVEPRQRESPQSAFARFERQVGQKQQIVHYYHQGTQLFPTPWEIALSNGGRRLLLSWKPEDGRSWAQVAAGASDAYINREARYIKKHYGTKKFFLAIHHEPEDEVRPTHGSGYTATDYRHMYQHVVNRFRKVGVKNAVFVMVYMGAQTYVNRSWFRNLWPGRNYVDWIAYDTYATPSRNGQPGGFAWLANVHWGSQFTGMYNWLVKNHPHKPYMLAEWGVAEKPGDAGYKARVFQGTPALLPHYPKLKALVYFDNPDARSGHVQVDTTRKSLTGYRSMLVGTAKSGSQTS